MLCVVEGGKRKFLPVARLFHPAQEHPSICVSKIYGNFLLLICNLIIISEIIVTHYNFQVLYGEHHAKMHM